MQIFNHYAEYMYYLLTSPFKRVRKAANQWYILMCVCGRRFDEVMERIYHARDQTAVAVCDPSMLELHAADRGMVRYEDETDESFRSRIANHIEVLRLGGTDAGVLLAVRSLGFENVTLVSAKEFTGDETRWAEFYIVLEFDADESELVSLKLLRQQVRAAKYVGAKENYCYVWRLYLKTTSKNKVSCSAVKYHTEVQFFRYLMLDGSWMLDGEKLLDAKRKGYGMSIRYQVKLQHTHVIRSARCHEVNNLYYLDGTWELDGSRTLDAWERTEVL